MAACVQPEARSPGVSRVNTYADPLSDPLSSSSLAPITIVSPSIEILKPNMSLAAPSSAVSLARCKYSTDVCVSLRRLLTGARSESGPVATAKIVPGATINARSARTTSDARVQREWSRDEDDRPLQGPNPDPGPSRRRRSRPSRAAGGDLSGRYSRREVRASDSRALTAVSSASRGAKVGVTDKGRIPRPFAEVRPSGECRLRPGVSRARRRAGASIA